MFYISIMVKVHNVYRLHERAPRYDLACDYLIRVECALTTILSHYNVLSYVRSVHIISVRPVVTSIPVYTYISGHCMTRSASAA